MNSLSKHTNEFPGHCNDKIIATQLAALGHPVRIGIIRHLSTIEACCCKDVVHKFDLAQSTISQHLKVLVEAGLVRLTPQNKHSRYEVDREALNALAVAIGGFLTACCKQPDGHSG